MLLVVEPDGAVPIYQQIRDRIVEAIARGEQPTGSALPSTRQLAVDLGINFHTVNKAYDMLRREGLVRLNRKSGAVIARDASGGPAAHAFTAIAFDQLNIAHIQVTALPRHTQIARARVGFEDQVVLS